MLPRSASRPKEVLCISYLSHSSMSSHAQVLADFRSQITKLLQERDVQWEASRRLVGANCLGSTLKRLLEEARRVEIPIPVRDAIEVALKQGDANTLQELPGPRLKELTGLPPTKAVRALCVWFDLVESPASQWPLSLLSSETVSAFIHHHDNPFDLLLEADVASLLDLGSGDLSFATELTDQYMPLFQQQSRRLTLHCVDRLHPDSKLGGPLHPEPQRLDALRTRPGLSFQFFGNQDMFALEELERVGRMAPHYTVATCWAPATPTFAYEPTRLSADVVRDELRRTKGTFRQTSFESEAALEVQHGNRTLLFPPWKFDIRGPLPLLDLMSRRGLLCILGAVDSQVFWELLAQLLDDERYRPRDLPFTAQTIPNIFGEIFDRLGSFAVDHRLNLADLGPIRAQLPRVLPVRPGENRHYRFSSIQIRRGAVFSNIPASSTARRFRDMVDETIPWFLCLVPERS
jgi:hypothetical protein